MQDLSKVSAESTQQVMEWAKQAVEFGKEQAPLLAQEIVRQGIVQCWFYIGVGGLFLAIAFVLFVLGKRRKPEKILVYLKPTQGTS